MKIEYNGRELTSRQLSDHVFHERGYRVSPRALENRYRAGLVGNALVVQPKLQAVHVAQWPSGVVPVPVAGWGAWPCA